MGARHQHMFGFGNPRAFSEAELVPLERLDEIVAE